MSSLPGPGLAQMEDAKSSESTDQSVMVVVEVRRDKGDTGLTVVRQALAVHNGKLVLTGPKREEHIEGPKIVGR